MDFEIEVHPSCFQSLEESASQSRRAGKALRIAEWRLPIEDYKFQTLEIPRVGKPCPAGETIGEDA
jgi:hypothetical protein